MSFRCLVGLTLLVVGACKGEHSRIILRDWETTTVGSLTMASRFSTTAACYSAVASG